MPPINYQAVRNLLNVKKVLSVKVIFNLNIVLSGCVLGLFTWKVTSLVKSIILKQYHLNLNEWTSIYYHPNDASLFNYIALCIVMSIYGLVSFVKIQTNVFHYVRKKLKTLSNQFPLLSVSSALVFFFLGKQLIKTDSLLTYIYLLCLLFILFVPINSAKSVRFLLRRDFACKVLMLLMFGLLITVSIEPVKAIKGPVYVINEYKNIYSDTKINNIPVNNKTFLDEAEKNKLSTGEFIKANSLEYFHQNSSWGPFNHIGHILNPLNEYICGKAPADVYMQYGKGNTLLYKWVMDLFGGLSVHNFYKCYIFYIVYSLLFFVLVLYLFQDILFSFNAFVIYSIAFFFAGYSVFVHAPGAIPTNHLFDTSVFLLALLYFRRNNPLYLLSALILATFSIYMNRQFGMVLLISLEAACLSYLWEHKERKEKYTLLSISVLLPFIIMATPLFNTTVNSSSTLYYFLMGYLSWGPDPVIVFLTIVYLVISYHFLFVIRKQTHYLKNAFIFLFIYSQGLLPYYFWNGQSNHLPIVIPFIGLELLLMVYISKELMLNTERANSIYLRFGIFAGTALLVFTCAQSINSFYKNKRVHANNFKQHRLYTWDFDRAKITTTINPEPFRKSIALIHKYSPQDNSGIHILSTYDNVLPFLAKRFSMMPFFEMQWFIFSQKEHLEAISRLKNQKPLYLFVENNIDKALPDPWEPLFNSPDLNATRKSNQEKLHELARIFAAVEESYEKVEEGALLSVYKRKYL